MSSLTEIQKAAQFLQNRFGKAPSVGVVLGSGLSPFAETLSNAKSMPTSELPGGVASTVTGHDGRLVCGKIGRTSVLVVAGRIHGYEGHSPAVVVHYLRALRLWGVKKFLITNAAGSTKKSLKPGSLVLLKDHINFTGQNPLTGTELFGGDRFPDMSDAYSKAWRKYAVKVARKFEIPIREGVYAAVPGPNYETAAEIKMFSKLGADLVGMSTVWEVIALKQMKTEILGLSCVTNFGTGVSSEPLTHAEVIDTTKKAQGLFNRFVGALLQKVD